MWKAFWLCAVVLCLAGCGTNPEDVPPEEAKVELSNPRVEREFGENVFLVDYEFTHGLPERGWMYRLQFKSSNGEEYFSDHYFNETQTSGTLDGKMSFLLERDDPSRRFDAHLEILVGTGPEFRPISNTVTFEIPEQK